jgi:hypothetical protein|nr:MAG TPA: hypothetical protein [Caudoviricetes sp.]
MSNIVKVGLIKGRHSLPVDDYIFNEVDDVFDYAEMSNRIHTKLKLATSVDLYVTGLTTALIEVVNYCIIMNTNLTLWHYDKVSNKFVSQPVDTNYWSPMLREGGYI